MAFDDGGGDVAEFAPGLLGVVAEQLEGVVGVDRVAGHEDAFGLLDLGAAPVLVERPSWCPALLTVPH